MSGYIGEREIGKFLPAKYGARREKQAIQQEEDRQVLRRLAMAQATITKRRDLIAKKMYQDQAITIDDWPALAALTPSERTRILIDVRKVYGLREPCDCPNKLKGIHRFECTRGRP